jgi:hypothetical protein
MEGELWPLAEVHQARRMVQVSTIVFLKKPTNTLLLTLLLYFTTQHLDAKGGGGGWPQGERCTPKYRGWFGNALLLFKYVI